MAKDQQTFLKNTVGKAFQEKVISFNPFDLPAFLEWIGNSYGVSRGLTLWIFYIAFLWLLSLEIPHLALFTVEWLVGLAPIWLLVSLYYTAVHVWVWYIQSTFLAGRETVLLEMKMPREITKSPRAMELALTVFNVSAGETTFIQRGWNGSTRPYFSFEIASFGGEVHFYIWCWKAWRYTVESTMYGYYPEIELHEVEDYAQKFQYDPKVYETYCLDWRRETFLKGVSNDSERIDAYPIKTYIDFELDKDPEEEYIIDPLANVIEVMGSIRPEDQMWAQIVIRKTGFEGIYSIHSHDNNWKNIVLKEVEKIRLESATFSELAHVTEEQKRYARPRPTWLQTQQMESMERNVGKYPFDVGMRGVYITKKTLDTQYWMAIRWLWRTVGNPQYMTFLRPRRWHVPFDYPWQDFHNLRWNHHAWRFFDAYRRRLFYFSPWKIPHNIMTNEEIATLWHPVSSAVATPGLQRIPAKKAEPPPNLPM